MITPMMKYSLVLYHREYQTFLEELQELGLVDVTTSLWEPSADDRALMAEIEEYRHGAAELGKLEAGAKAKKSYGSVDEAFTAYSEAAGRTATLGAKLAKTEKEIAELRPWGEFPVNDIRKLEEAGVMLHFYSLFTKEFDDSIGKWSENHIVQEVSRDGMNVFFVAAIPEGETLDISAQPLKAPTADVAEKIAEKNRIEKEIAGQTAIIEKSAPYADDFDAVADGLSNRLHLSKVARSGGEREAEGTLVVMEGWAAEATQDKVDEFLEDTGVFYIKEKPSQEDETPVLLKNNCFTRIFETIGNFYTLPKYGTTDLTPYYGPFYALFFGFCLGDAGYGLLYVLAGLYMILKLGETMKGIGWLVISCGTGAILFGALTGNIFGIQLAKSPIFYSMKDIFFDSDKLFVLAIALGFVHLFFAMGIRIIGTTRREGFKYAASTLGWTIVIVSSLAAFLLPGFGIGFSVSSPAYLALLGIGVFMMLFLNSPGRNPLFNFGAGLWNTYNDITGLLSDVLSYIRLFAICLSGGVLALVFNQLAEGMSPDIPVVKQLVMLFILAIGHGINLFMSSLSSFVHPMRLTFVEFYKNSGFESSSRAFTPLKK